VLVHLQRRFDRRQRGGRCRPAHRKFHGGICDDVSPAHLVAAAYEVVSSFDEVGGLLALLGELRVAQAPVQLLCAAGRQSPQKHLA
jgi:hypothetical protein